MKQKFMGAVTAPMNQSSAWSLARSPTDNCGFNGLRAGADEGRASICGDCDREALKLPYRPKQFAPGGGLLPTAHSLSNACDSVAPLNSIAAARANTLAMFQILMGSS
jgi:hypothetical protein